MGYKLQVDIFKMLRGDLKQKEKKKNDLWIYRVKIHDNYDVGK